MLIRGSIPSLETTPRDRRISDGATLDRHGAGQHRGGCELTSQQELHRRVDRLPLTLYRLGSSLDISDGLFPDVPSGGYGIGFSLRLLDRPHARLITFPSCRLRIRRRADRQPSSQMHPTREPSGPILTVIPGTENAQPSSHIDHPAHSGTVRRSSVPIGRRVSFLPRCGRRSVRTSPTPRAPGTMG